jgi:hypothetical protein
MTWNEFQNELGWIWSDPTGQNYDRSHASDIKRVLKLYHWEIGKMELDGATKKEQMAFAWKMYKKEFPHLVESRISGIESAFKTL